jgi:hypothetical protein
MRRATNQASIAIFAKAPIAGFVKTRLIPAIGAEGAARLQTKLIVRTIETALAAEIGPVSLWCTPDRQHELFRSVAETHDIEIHEQTGVDLRMRMLRAFETLTLRHPTILIGTDCPALKANHLRDCIDALGHGADAVFVPAEDGGYVLVGMRKPIPDLFAGIPWGTDRVMAETRLRAAQFNVRIAEPATLWDLDTAADHARAKALGMV